MGDPSLDMNASRSAALSGRGTGFGVRDSQWSREFTEDGRVYYYNRATGGSQWHLPDELYNAEPLFPGEPSGVVFPTHAKATLRVDCVTEVLNGGMQVGSAGSTGAGDLGNTAHLKGGDLLAALERDPRHAAKAFHRLPAAIAAQLRSAEFDEECAATFQDEAGDDELPLMDCLPLVDKLLIGFDAEPPLRPAGRDRLLTLADVFDSAGNGQGGPSGDTIGAEDFVSFAKFVITFQGLEQFDSADDD